VWHKKATSWLAEIEPDDLDRSLAAEADALLRPDAESPAPKPGTNLSQQ
jgi:hypothetical protein